MTVPATHALSVAAVGSLVYTLISGDHVATLPAADDKGGSGLAFAPRVAAPVRKEASQRSAGAVRNQPHGHQSLSTSVQRTGITQSLGSLVSFNQLGMNQERAPLRTLRLTSWRPI